MSALKKPAMLRGKFLALALLLTPILVFAQEQIAYIDLNRFIIEGHTLLQPQEFAEVLNPFIGKSREPSAVHRAIEALKQRYRADGVCIAGILASEQNFDEGVITLRVIEERIGNLTFEGKSLRGDLSVRSCVAATGVGSAKNTGEVLADDQQAKQNSVNTEPQLPEHFDLNSFLVEGNTLLQPEDIEAILKPFTGKQRGYDQVQRAVEALRQRYIAGGFHIAGVIASDQDFEKGVVTLQVIEARIGKFTKEGTRHGDNLKVITRLPVFMEEIAQDKGHIQANTQPPNENPALIAKAQTVRFAIDHFKVEGNTLLAQDEIESLLAPFTGKNREYLDLQRAIDVLRQRYRSKGFSAVWVTAPEQDIDQGIVTLKVLEAKIGKITIEGNLFFDEANIRASLPSLREGVEPRAGDISANTQLANENPAKQVDIVLRPGKNLGEVDATVNVIDTNPLKAFMTLDNSGNSQTGYFRLGGGLQDANLFNQDDVGTFNYITSPGKWRHVSLYSGSYRMPIYSRGDSMDFILAYSDVSAGSIETVAGPLAFSGKGSVYSLRYNQLLERKGNYSGRIIYGVDKRAYLNSCSLGNFGAAGCGPSSVDITLRPVSVAYSGNWAIPGKNLDYNASLSRNVPGGVNGHESDFNAARPSQNGSEGATSRYSIFRSGVNLTTAFQSNWQVRASFNAQHTPNALVSGEQLGLTGSNAVRGFPEREISRDNGYFANFELYTPNLASDLISGNGNLRALIFYDVGSASNNPLPSETGQHISISSVGGGFRWSIQKNFNMRFDLARVVKEGGSKKAGDVSAHISAYLGY